MIAPVARPGGKGEPRDVKVQVRLTKEAVTYIDALAEQQGQTRSDMLRILIRRGIGLRGESLDPPERSMPARPVSPPATPVREAVRGTEPREEAPAVKSSREPDPSDKLAYGKWLKAQRR